MHTRLVILALLSLGLSACNAVKPNAEKGAAKHYETFFVGEEGTQYFIKPLEFKSESGERLLLDVTYRYKKEISGYANLNFSILSETVIKDIDQAQFSDTYVEKLDLMFNERVKDEIESRFSGTIPLKALHQIFSDSEGSFTLSTAEGQKKFMASPAAEKAMNKLKSDLFELM